MMYPPRHRRDDGVPSVKDLVNLFLNAQQQKEANGSNGGNWYDECVRVATHFANHIGKDRPWNDLIPSVIMHLTQGECWMTILAHGNEVPKARQLVPGSETPVAQAFIGRRNPPRRVSCA